MDIKPEGFKDVAVADPWEVLFQAKKKEQSVVAQVVSLDLVGDKKDKNKKGKRGTPTWKLSFGVDGITGVVPESESGLSKNMMQRFVGQEIRVKIKGLVKEDNLVACSRREAVADAAEKLLPELAKDPEKIWDGVARTVLPPEDGKPVRLIVDVGGGVLAEIPRKEAAIWMSKTLGQQYPPGAKVKVKITRVDQKTGIISASILKARPDPWDKANFERGQFVSATVVSISNGIVFLETDAAPGVIGIASVPLIGEIERRSRVTCFVASFDREKRHLRLRLRGRA